MTKTENKRGLVPKLRFPEFREAGEWDADELGIVAEFVNEKIPVGRVSLDGYVSTESILPDFEGIAIASRLPATGSVTRFTASDTLVSNIRPYLKKVWYADKEGGASNDVIVIRAKRNLLPQYLSFLLKSDAFIDYVMAGAKGVKMPRGDIDSMKQYAALYPPTGEQQKIADCLTSLDDLIRLEAEKLEALKTHKKGLMQQLFPAEGETVPKLRFPEFREAGEWSRMPLDTIAKFYKGKGIAKADIDPNGDTLCIRYGELYTTYSEVIGEVVSKTSIPSSELFLSRCNDVLIPSSGETKLDIAKASCVMLNDVALGSDLNVLRSDANGIFLSYLLNGSCSAEIAKIAQGDTVVHLYASQLKALNIAIPKLAEQQKIADCLTSLDSQITTQAEKIEALKTHKKGLMQQLFPVLDDAAV